MMRSELAMLDTCFALVHNSVNSRSRPLWDDIVLLCLHGGIGIRLNYRETMMVGIFLDRSLLIFY